MTAYESHRLKRERLKSTVDQMGTVPNGGKRANCNTPESLSSMQKADQQTAPVNWNSLALIALYLCGSSIFLNHTITKALFRHTHVHAINI